MNRSISRLTKIFISVLFITTGVNAQSGQIPLRPAANYKLSGRVFDETSKPGVNVRVCAAPGDAELAKLERGLRCGISNQNGEFVLGVTYPGKYRLLPDQPQQGYLGFQPFYAPPGFVAPEVIINSETRAPVSVILPPRNGFIKGKSIDVKTGLPPESIEFLLCHADNPQICRGAAAKGVDGLYRIPAPHVPFTLRARAAGFAEWSGVSGSDNAPITVGSGDTLKVDIYLTRALDSIDKPLTNAEKQVGVNLPAPPQLNPVDGQIFNHYPRTTKLEWASVEGAVSYGIELDYCAMDHVPGVCNSPNPHHIRLDPPKHDIKGTSYEFSFVGAQPGRWRVWAVDKEGREGFKSEWRMFLYLK